MYPKHAVYGILKRQDSPRDPSLNALPTTFSIGLNYSFTYLLILVLNLVRSSFVCSIRSLTIRSKIDIVLSSLNEHRKRSLSKPKKSTPGKGRWTGEEHRIFLEGLERYGSDWNAISNLVKTRTPVQTRTHHQKFDQQKRKGRQFPEEVCGCIFLCEI